VENPAQFDLWVVPLISGESVQENNGRAINYGIREPPATDKNL
jgi:hypothetical protein